MANSQRPLSDFISSVEQVSVVEDVPTEDVGGNTPPKKSKAFPIIVGVLLFLILLAGGFFVYKQFFATETPEDPSFKPQTTFGEDDQGREIEEVTYGTDKVTWTLYNLHEYNFSAELPDYTMEQIVPSHEEKVVSNWSVKLVDLENTLYPNYITTANIIFFPENSEELFACGQGCAQEHSINVSIFKNEGAKSIDDIKNLFLDNLEKSAEDQYDMALTSKEQTKWDHQVVSFEYNDMMGTNQKGYILSNSTFVYIIEYFISSTPKESFDIANKVLDSFEFGN